MGRDTDYRKDLDNIIGLESNTEVANQVDALVMPDYCLMCGQEVEPDKWRDHMKHHNIVLTDSPKTADGEWRTWEHA